MGANNPRITTLNPSFVNLPQKLSDDRKRGREATRKLQKKRFRFDHSDKFAEDQEKDLPALPPKAESIPDEVAFPLSQTWQLKLSKWEMNIDAALAYLRTLPCSFRKGADYVRLYESLGGDSSTVGKWRVEGELGRQRLHGVNPMRIRQVRKKTHAPLWEAARDVLQHKGDDIDERLRAGDLYIVEYPECWDRSVRDKVCRETRDDRPVRLAAPTCLFWHREGQLLPVAIQLKPADVKEKNPVFTPQHPPTDWQLARAHVSCADAHVHEGIHHLLETHLVNEAIALCMFRELHPDHPICQLLTPHFQGTMSINKIAHEHLLSPTGPIQKAMAAGADGVRTLARIYYKQWSWSERSLVRDIETRGLEKLQGYHYRDDAMAIFKAFKKYIKAYLNIFYRSAQDIAEDYELKAFIDAVGKGPPHGGGIPGFPTFQSLDNRDKLTELITEIMFRAGPQHAAVNNGQFDTYGEIANAPGMLYGELPDALDPKNPVFNDGKFWESLPKPEQAIAQMGMVWVLSLPTRRNLMAMGQFPSLDPCVSFELTEAISALRQRLQEISYNIKKRNTGLVVPYGYLDPMNVSLSTDV